MILVSVEVRAVQVDDLLSDGVAGDLVCTTDESESDNAGFVLRHMGYLKVKDASRNHEGTKQT